MFLYNGSKNNGNSNNINSIYHHFNSCYMGSVAIMRTPRQQRNHEKFLRQKQKVINYLNENEMIVFFLLGLSFLVMVGFLAVAVA